MGRKGKKGPALRPTQIWDTPTRCFHWLLVALTASSFATGKLGGNWTPYHERCGEAVLALLLFRAAWGFIGSTPSRFRSFVKGPGAVMRYARSLFRREAEHHLSHNPLGGWSVVAMLLVLLLQAGTGLFANDDIAATGPLYKWVAKSDSDRLTRIHRANQDAILILVGLHVAAVLFHLIYKRENLIRPMITGVKPVRRKGTAGLFRAPAWRAAVAAAAAAGAVAALVGW